VRLAADLIVAAVVGAATAGALFACAALSRRPGRWPVLQRADVAAGHRLEPWLGGGVIVVAFGFWVEAKTFGPRRDEGDSE
jgi:hypothetical protein